MRGTSSQMIRDVTVIADLGVALICQVDGRRTVIPRALVLAGSEVAKPGDHGALVVPRQFAFDLGLVAEEGELQPVEA